MVYSKYQQAISGINTSYDKAVMGLLPANNYMNVASHFTMLLFFIMAPFTRSFRMYLSTGMIAVLLSQTVYWYMAYPVLMVSALFNAGRRGGGGK